MSSLPFSPTEHIDEGAAAEKHHQATTTSTSNALQAHQSQQDNSFGSIGGSVAAQKWWTDEEESKVRWKLDLNIIPQLFIIYACAFLDRSNIGNAKTAGMATALDIDDGHYRLITAIFYISYILCQSLLLFYLVVPAHIWVAGAVLTWGLASSLQATAVSFSGLMAARFFLGAAEAAFGTGVALYLGFFYPRFEVGYRFAWFVTSSAVASAIAGAIAYGLVQTNTAIAGWRLLFVVEGAPSIICAVFIFFFLPDKPSSCRFLNERERQIADARLFKPVAPTTAAVQNEGQSKITTFVRSKMDPASIKAGLLNPVAWMTALLLWVVNVGYGSLPIYLPQILSESGASSLKSQAYTCGPYLVAWVAALTETYASDKLHHRMGFLFMDFAIGIAGYLMLAISETFEVRYAATFLVALGLFPAVPLVYTILITNNSSEKARGIGLSILGTVSQTAPLVGTLALYTSATAPYYKKGNFISLGVLVFGVFVASVATIYFYLSNRRRDREQRHEEELFTRSGSGEEKMVGASRVDQEKQALALKTKLDMKDPKEKEEALRRYIAVGRQGEDSPYFRYII